jgi:hypothetical protein
MIERHRPPAWDPPILLLVDGKLIEVTTLGVVVAIVGWAAVSVAPSSGLDNLIRGEKESKATVSTLKYSASKDLHYICNIIK